MPNSLIRIACALILAFIPGCEDGCGWLYECVTGVTHGLLDGKVVGRGREGAFMIDRATVLRPESDSALFVVAVGPSHEERREWVVEVDCGTRKFVHGIGATPFVEWPDPFRLFAVEYSCSQPGLTGEPQFVLARFSKSERQEFLSSPEGERAAKIAVAALTEWAWKHKAVEQDYVRGTNNTP